MPTGIFRLSLLARRGWCGLFDFPAIYEKDSYANLCWTAYRAVPGGPVIALLLHVDKSVGDCPGAASPF